MKKSDTNSDKTKGWNIFQHGTDRVRRNQKGRNFRKREKRCGGDGTNYREQKYTADLHRI